MGNGGSGNQPKHQTAPRKSTTDKPTLGNTPAPITSLQEATAWLTKEEVLEEDDSPGDARIAFYITNRWLERYSDKDVSQAARNSIKALQYYLVESERLKEERDKRVEGVVEKAVEKAMEVCVEGCKEVLGNLAEATMRTVKELGEKMVETASQLEEGQIIEKGQTNQGKDGYRQLTQRNVPKRANQAAGIPSTYADAARQAEHAEVMDRTATRRRQVLVDGPKDSEEMKKLTEKELLAKAQMAKDGMGLAGMDAPELRFISVRKLRNGGALYELNTIEAAEWLTQPDVKKLFLEKYGVGTTVKDKTYALIAEFVPTTLGDDPSGCARTIEDDNQLHPMELLEVKWVRAPHTRRDPNQRVGHLMLMCATPEGANHAIDRGLVIEGKHVQARRMQNEPRRCMKCQQQGKGHYASECKQTNETCGICAQNHRTRECKETDPTKFKCVNCRSRGLRHDHPSSSRTCPVFVEAKERLMTRTPEMGYKYFPTTEPKTWIRMDEYRNTNEPRYRAWTNNGRGTGRLAGGAAGQGGGVPKNTNPSTPNATQATASSQNTGSQLHQTKIMDFNWGDDVEREENDRNSRQSSPAGPEIVDELTKQMEATRKLLERINAAEKTQSPWPSQ